MSTLGPAHKYIKVIRKHVCVCVKESVCIYNHLHTRNFLPLLMRFVARILNYR